MGDPEQEYKSTTMSESFRSTGGIKAYNSSSPRRRSSNANAWSASEALQSEEASLEEPETDTRAMGTFSTFSNPAFHTDPSSARSSPSPVAGKAAYNNLMGGEGPPSRSGNSIDKPRLSSSLKNSLRNTFMAHHSGVRSTEVEEFSGPATRRSGPHAHTSHDGEEEEVVAVARPLANTNRAGQLATGADVWQKALVDAIGRSPHECVMRPGPSGGMARCYMRRSKGFMGMHPVYQLYLQHGDVFLLSARKRKKSRDSTHLVSLDRTDLKRDSSAVLAKLKANYVGSEYVLLERGAGASRPGKDFAREALALHYKSTALSLEAVPRTMNALLPRPEDTWRPSRPDRSDSLSACLDRARHKEMAPSEEHHVCLLHTNPPQWDPKVKGHTLDFKGRVKEASVKNFQLVAWNHNTNKLGGDIILMFGKYSDDVYTCDFAYPLNALQAFALGLASIDSKLCCSM